jgi:hypothetical protein
MEEGVDTAGGGRVFSMEVFDGSLGVFEVVFWFPSVFFISETLPLDEVLELFVSEPRVKDLFYFVFLELSDDLG